MKMTLRTATDGEKEQLLALASGVDAATARRAKIVLLILDGHDLGGIAQALGVTERTVRRVIKRYNEGGAEGLQQRSSPGRTGSVSQAEREGLIALIRCSPEEFGIYSPCWKPADLEAVAKREGVLSAVTSRTLRRELARIIQLEPEIEDRLHLPGQSRSGAPSGNHNALQHGACGRLPLCEDERALIAEAQAELRRDYPGAGEAGAGLIGEAAIAYLQFSRTIFADFREADRRAVLRWRKALRGLKAAERRRKLGNAPKITPAEWASDLVTRYLKYEKQNG